MAGVQIGSLFFEVTANTQGARASIEGLGSAATDASKLIAEALGVAFATAALAAATAVAKVTYEVIQLGTSFNIAGQKATGLFTALTGSAEEAVGLMRQFAQISLDQPIFSTEALQETTRTLLAYGVAKEDVLDMSVALNSAATALGIGAQGADRLALALGQVKGKGFFSAEEARQLGNYGVNAYKLIADAAGLTVAQVRALGKEHKLLADDVLPILTEQLQKTFGPVAQNLVNTYGVQVQGLKNILTGVGSALVQPFIGRTGGGAAVEFLTRLRAELGSVVEVGDDGVYRLTGALSGLNDVTEALAAGFTELGDSFLDWITSAVSGGGIDDITSGIAGAIPDIVSTIQDLTSGTVDFIGDLANAIKPIIPDLEMFGGIIYEFLVEALPIAADGVVDLVGALAIMGHELASTALPALAGLVPVLVDLVQAAADLAGILRDLAPYIKDMIILWLGWKAAVIGAEIATASFVEVALSPLSAMLLGIATAAGAALAALGALRAARAGLGDEQTSEDFMFGDQPFYAKPFQKVAQFGFALGGGTDNYEAAKAAQAQREELQKGEVAGRAYEAAMEDLGLSMNDYAAQARAAGLDTATLSYAIIAYKDHLDAVQQANVDAGNAIDAFAAANAFEARVADAAADSLTDLNIATEDTIDLMDELKAAAKDAWAEVDRLTKIGPDATVDDFFRDLLDVGKKLTTAMGEDAGVLKDLDVSGALDTAKQKADAVIKSLAKDYGLSMEQIRALFDERGLAGVIEALGHVTEETTKAVDPLIAKYGDLGATASELKDAINRLNDQRQTAIKAQIDQVQAALRDAKQAAVDARDAINDFFTGGQPSGTQKLIDTLIGNVGDIGSRIEDGLKLGGEQGSAAIRLALGDVREQLAGIVNAGLEDGLTGQQIVDMLGPIGTVLGEQAQQALNRISSLDWTEGFTPAAGAEISRLLSGLLDPDAIQKLISDALGADNTVTGLEKQLEDLQAAAQVDAVFSKEQVQGALDAIKETSVVTTPVVTHEAAQAVYQAIQDELDRDDLETGIDKAVITQQILDAALDAQNQVHLVFDSALSFDNAKLQELAMGVSEEFYNAFNANLAALADAKAQENGFQNAYAMEQALGPVVAGAVMGGTQVTQTVQTDVTVNGAQDPRATASEIVAANSAAAGSGGAYDPSKYYGRGSTRTSL